MITYVNTVLVGTGVGTLGTIANGVITATAGQFVVMDKDGKQVVASSATAAQTNAATAESIKVGLMCNDKSIKWSNWINKDQIKSYNVISRSTNDENPESAVLNFGNVDFTELHGKRVVIRLTYKDLPTKYRKWSESYEFICSATETATSLCAKIAAKINKEIKRARVEAAVSGTTNVVLTALPYDDDNMVDSISWANTVRFSVAAWYTDPMAPGFASKNKYSIAGLNVTKTPGKVSKASTKLVRDMEANAMGYQGILNRGECTWPVIKPAMNVDLSKQYDGFTLEFENAYRSADDLNRKTKQTLNVFEQLNGTATRLTDLERIIEAFVKGSHATVALGTSDIEA